MPTTPTLVQQAKQIQLFGLQPASIPSNQAEQEDLKHSILNSPMHRGIRKLLNIHHSRARFIVTMNGHILNHPGFSGGTMRLTKLRWINRGVVVSTENRNQYKGKIYHSHSPSAIKEILLDPTPDLAERLIPMLTNPADLAFLLFGQSRLVYMYHEYRCHGATIDIPAILAIIEGDQATQAMTEARTNIAKALHKVQEFLKPEYEAVTQRFAKSKSTVYKQASQAQQQEATVHPKTGHTTPGPR